LIINAAGVNTDGCGAFTIWIGCKGSTSVPGDLIVLARQFKLHSHFSNIIETKYGYHIVYIDRKRISRILTEREAYNAIKQKLFMEKYSSALNDYINHLSDKTYIEILEPELEQEFTLKNENEKPVIVNPTPNPNISPATEKSDAPASLSADDEQ
jgi:hypothetical protein